MTVLQFMVIEYQSLQNENSQVYLCTDKHVPNFYSDIKKNMMLK